MNIKFSIKDLNLWFGSTQAIKSLNLDIYSNEILSIIGPSNSGKTTFLRMLNRLNELESKFKFFYFMWKFWIDSKGLHKIVFIHFSSFFEVSMPQS